MTIGKAELFNGLTSNCQLQNCQLNMMDDGSFKTYPPAGTGATGASASASGDVTFTVNASYHPKGTQKEFKLFCNSGQIVSDPFKVNICLNTAQTNSPSARTINADAVVPVSNLWSGTYCGNICELQVQYSSNNWIYYASSGFWGAILEVDGSVSFSLSDYSPYNSEKIFRTKCSGTL